MNIDFKKLFSLTQNKLLGTSLYTGFSTVINYISGFIVQKIVAISVGPSGVAVISQFTNFLTISNIIVTGGVQDGVVKYASENKGNLINERKIIGTSSRIILSVSLILGLITILFSNSLSHLLFATGDYSLPFILFGATASFFGFNQFFLSLLNGFGEIKKYVYVKVSTSFFSLFVVSVSVYFYGILGALIALSLSQSIILIISSFFVFRSRWFNLEYFFEDFDGAYFKKMLYYTAITIISVVLPTLVQIFIRNYISDNLSVNQAGIWDGMVKISNSYLGIVTTTLAIYYLPKLSSIKSKELINFEIKQAFFSVMPFMILVIPIIFLVKKYLILILFSEEFLQMESLFAYQLAGDFFKIMSWLIAILMIAKAMIKMFIITQIIFSFFTFVISVFCINIWGLEGVSIAHFVKYVMYFIVVSILLKDYILIKK